MKRDKKRTKTQSSCSSLPTASRPKRQQITGKLSVEGPPVCPKLAAANGSSISGCAVMQIGTYSDFLSAASIAANLRSTCDLERGAPEFSTQLFQAGTPHAGHRTDEACLGVSSLFLISDRIR
jgi:hypothetical protein